MFLPPRPFRVGCTSFVLRDHVLPNVEWLAGKVEDVQLLLLDAQQDVPGPEVFLRLAELSRLYGLSYTVHLPDIPTGDGAAREQAHRDLVKLIALSLPLDPLGYVVHVAPAPPVEPDARASWVDQAAQSLRLLVRQTGVPLSRLQVENQEWADLPAHAAIVEATGCSMCLDVGHVLREGVDPLAAVERYLALAPHVHLHGVADRDHRSLVHYPRLDQLVQCLLLRGYTGVVTLEMFGLAAFEESLEALRTAWPTPDRRP